MTVTVAASSNESHDIVAWRLEHFIVDTLKAERESVQHQASNKQQAFKKYGTLGSIAWHLLFCLGLIMDFLPGETRHLDLSCFSLLGICVSVASQHAAPTNTPPRYQAGGLPTHIVVYIS